VGAILAGGRAPAQQPHRVRVRPAPRDTVSGCAHLTHRPTPPHPAVDTEHAHRARSRSRRADPEMLLQEIDRSLRGLQWPSYGWPLIVRRTWAISATQGLPLTLPSPPPGERVWRRAIARRSARPVSTRVRVRVRR
jgi:hypothetical protein